jgi:hypothetical protein
MLQCTSCGEEIGEIHGAPYLEFKKLRLCSGCYQELIIPIFEMRGMGDGGLIDIIFTECVRLDHNLKWKKKKIPISALRERIGRCFGK